MFQMEIKTKERCIRQKDIKGNFGRKRGVSI